MSGESRFLILHFAVCITVIYAKSPTRIVDGTEAYEIPYLVSLQTPSGHLVCGGAILDSKHILTAAHCFIDERGNEYRQKLSIVTGTNDLKNRTSRNTFQISRVTIPNSFRPRNSYANDIAVIKLNGTITFTRSQKPVKLPSSNTPVGTSLLISGWGATHWSKFHRKADAYPQYVRYFYNRVISPQQCQRMMSTEHILSGHICAWGGGRGSTCKGDSGGPAVFGRTIVGVVSFNQYCNPSYPDVYTRVYEYVDWIRKTVKTD